MYSVNPSLQIIKKKDNFLFKWESITSNKILKKSATDKELLIIKIIIEQLNPIEISQEYSLNLNIFHKLLDNCIKNELIVKEPPLIRRDSDKFPLKLINFPQKFLQPEVFTLQWHITNRCDLKCKHCYDRTKREDVTYGNAIKIMEEFYNFTFKHSVFPQISFTGGNPFLHKDFFEIYKKANEFGFIIGILGNPVSEKELEKIINIKKPSFYQISLEGTEKYNDYIRGKGHFNKSIQFLKLLKDYNIYSNVMLTLHNGNINYVFELIDTLEGLVDSFTFNRLSNIGEGKHLEQIEKESFKNFLKKYLYIAKNKHFIRLKENLLNIYLYKEENTVFGGCTGFGCGAAFNFVALLPDGEVHACRKFPSFIGNIYKNNFEKIYYSNLAEQYRIGPDECKNCPINRVCRGCLAIIYSSGFNYRENKDPYCFIS